MLRLPEDWQRGLCIVAHPDDVEYGAAAAVARWTAQGKQVAYLLVTRGEAGIDSMAPADAAPLREAEQRRAAAVVGVDEVRFLDGYTDGLIEYDTRLRCDLAREIRRFQPDVVISINANLRWAGGALNMADHRNVGLAVLDAVRDAANRWIFPELADAGFQPWDGVRFVAFNASPDVTHGVDVTDTFEMGERSLAEHRTYLEAVGGPPEWLRSAALATGRELGCELATGFEVVVL